MANSETMNQFYLNTLQRYPENYVNDITVNRAVYWGMRRVFDTLGEHGHGGPDTRLLDIVTETYGDRTAYAITEEGVTSFSLRSWRLVASGGVLAITFPEAAILHQNEEFDVAYARV